jgi:ABC-2 type transport system permease protein
MARIGGARIGGAGTGGAGMSNGGSSATEPRLPAATGGALSPLARVQYSALAEMRWQAFRNGLRSTRGVLEATASGLSYVLYAVMGLGITAGMGTGAYFMASKGLWQMMPLLLWGLFFIWQVMPIGVASLQQQFDLNGLLRFPMGFQPFFVLHLIFGLVDTSTILGGLGCFGICVGITLAHPELFGWTALALIAFGAFNVLLSRAIFAWLDRWLAQRRTREILSALFFIALLSAQFLNPALRHHTRATAAARTATEHRLATAGAAQSWLPPGLAVLTIERAAEGHPAGGLESLALLGIYGLATGLALSVRLRAEHRGENLSDAPQPRKAEKRAAGKTSIPALTAAPVSIGESMPVGVSGSVSGSGPAGAIIGKELRIVMRSLPLLYAVFAPLLMVIVLASIMGQPKHAGYHLPMAVPLCVAYALLGFTQLIYNNLGTEGAAVQLLFLSPTPIRTVFLAKNMFHALLFGLIAMAAGLLAAWRLGAPSAAWLAATVAWLLFALPAHMAVGNIFSLTMPHKINLGRIGRQRGAQASALLGMLVQLAVLGVGAATVGLCLVFGQLWMATPILLVLAVPACFVWLRVLGNTEAMANRRRDELIGTLAKAD